MKDLPKDFRTMFKETIVPIIEDKFLFQTKVVFTNKVHQTGYCRRPLRKRRDLTPFGFDFHNMAVEAHPLSTEYVEGEAFTRILVWILKGHRTFNMGIIEVSHVVTGKRDFDEG